MNPSDSPARASLPILVVHTAAALIVVLLLVSVGQPLFSEDTWWHLTMGRAYAIAGPWLASDPALHTAIAAPAPAAWLADVALHGIQLLAGFQGLRIAHLLLVVAILLLVRAMSIRASSSAAVASLGTAIFVVLATYRLFQLRPHLFSILATLGLIQLLLLQDREAPPAWHRVLIAAGIMGLWANMHASFMLGPILLGAALAGLLTRAALAPEYRMRDLARAGRLAAAIGLRLLATLVNPAGARLHLLYLSAGSGSPELARVADEWGRFPLLEFPVPNLPPSLLAWGCVWLLLVGTLGAVLAEVFRHVRKRDLDAPGRSIDPALAAVAMASLVAMLSAVRFLWLGVFPFLFLVQFVRAGGALGQTLRLRAAWISALLALLLVPAFLRAGDWPMVSRMIHRETYSQPYPAAKFHDHGVWFLRDAGIEGNLFNDYSSGNFLGYWLAPRMRVFVNGSLNLPLEAMNANQAILRRGWQSEASFTDLLDRYQVDVFFGTKIPAISKPSRPDTSTLTHLEGAPDWLLVFRSLQNAVYLRNDARNGPNLQRVIDYYERAGVPFDPTRGFRVEAVVAQAPRWAFEHALIPADWQRLVSVSNLGEPAGQGFARERLASIYAAMGFYARAAELDRRTLQHRPDSVPSARRLVWCKLHQGRVAEALEAARRLASIAQAGDMLSQILVAAPSQLAALSDQDAAALISVLPLFTRPEATRVSFGFLPPEPRKQ